MKFSSFQRCSHCLAEAPCPPCNSPLGWQERGGHIGRAPVWWREPGACPDCGGRAFTRGRSGGLSENIQCQHCGAWWNDMILLIQRLPDDSARAAARRGRR